MLITVQVYPATLYQHWANSWPGILSVTCEKDEGNAPGCLYGEARDRF